MNRDPVDPTRDALMDACRGYNVEFIWSRGILMIDLKGIEPVLKAVEDRFLVLGFDTFTIEGKWTKPRLDYISSYGEGITVDGALADITDWPRDMGLWIQAVVAERHPDRKLCVRCGREVEDNAEDYETFEKMHYVCFHYEHEHSGDVDVECNAGGCPSAWINRRLERRPPGG